MPVVEVEERREVGPTRAQRGMEVWAHIVVKSPKGMLGYWLIDGRRERGSEGARGEGIRKVDERGLTGPFGGGGCCSQWIGSCGVGSRLFGSTV